MTSKKAAAPIAKKLPLTSVKKNVKSVAVKKAVAKPAAKMAMCSGLIPADTSIGHYSS
jgi:hypothetical protein